MIHVRCQAVTGHYLLDQSMWGYLANLIQILV
jgi:hypothetical protein